MDVIALFYQSDNALKFAHIILHAMVRVAGNLGIFFALQPVFNDEFSVTD